MIYLKFLRNVFVHKWFVFIAGWYCGVSLYRCLIHDWSKFTPTEFFAYSRRFGSGVYDKSAHGAAFDRAWLHHQRLNLHHWQAWCQVKDDSVIRPLKMPGKYVREMVADWWAAGRGYEGRWKLPEWYAENRDRMHLHPDTRLQVEALIIETADRLLPGWNDEDASTDKTG